MEQLNIKKKGDLYCLNDWVENVVHSKNPRGYYYKLKHYKEKIDGKWYVDKNSMTEIYNKSTLMHGNGINGPYGKYGKLYKHKDKDTVNEKENVITQKDTSVVKETKRNPVVYKMDSNVSSKEPNTYNDKDDISEYSVDEDYELDDIDLNEDEVNDVVTIAKPVTENRLIDINNGIIQFDGKYVKMVTDKNNEIWFKGGDVAAILEYSDKDKSLRNHVDNEDKIEYEKMLLVNSNQSILIESQSNTKPPAKIAGGLIANIKVSKHIYSNTIFINESGLYSLIMKSKMKKAKEFQRWVTKEVLPSIRKTGQYDIKDSIKTNTVSQLAYDINDYLNKNAVYLLHMEGDVYKFGVTKNMKKRDSELKRMKYKSIHKIYTVKNNDIGLDVEHMIKNYVKQAEIHRHFNIYTRKVLMPYDKSTKEGTCTEFFVANAETLATVEKNINNYILIKTNEYNEKEGIEEKDESTKLQIKLAELNRDKNYNEEVSILKLQQKNYIADIERSKLDIEKTKFHIEKLKLEVELERLKYGGDKYYRDNPEKNVVRKSRREYNCINDNCKWLTYNKDKLCKYCTCRKTVLNSTKNGRPSYSKLQNDLLHMNYNEIGTKYNTTGDNIRTWIRMYKKYNLLD